jgi:hypothetical protein
MEILSIRVFAGAKEKCGAGKVRWSRQYAPLSANFRERKL